MNNSNTPAIARDQVRLAPSLIFFSFGLPMLDFINL